MEHYLKIIKELRKRNDTLRSSRNYWRRLAIANRDRADRLQCQLNDFKRYARTPDTIHRASAQAEIRVACLERENRDLRAVNASIDQVHEENRLLLAHIAHQERTIGKLYSALTLWSLVAQGRIEISPCPVMRIDQ